MRRTIAVLTSVLLLGLAAHGVGAQGKGSQGSTVSKLAVGTCVAANPHHPKVKNHGQCVAAAARGASRQHGTGAEGQSTPGAGTHDHGKHLGKTKGKGHAGTTHPGGEKEQPEATDAPEATEAPEPTDTP